MLVWGIVAWSDLLQELEWSDLLQELEMNKLSQTVKEISRRKELVFLLNEDLTELLEQPGEVGDVLWVSTIIDTIIDHLTELLQQEDYLAEVIEQYPSWYPLVVHLQEEHQLLCRQLSETRDVLRLQSETDIVTSEMRRQLSDWVKHYKEHEHRESLLVLDAFTLEVGEGE